MPNIIRRLLPLDMRLTPPKLGDDLPFGKVHSSHMFICDFLHDRGGWQDQKIVPFAPFTLEPDSVAFHYGQQIFEGLKAYRLRNSKEIALFRPEQNARRFYHSAERLGMEPVPVEMFLQGIKALVAVDQEFVLPLPFSLYIRPCLIPLERGVSYRASLDYRFFIILCTVKQYFNSNATMSVYVEEDMVRAVRGGTGDIKAGANYAASVLALQRAKSRGADSVLWLDALERRFVEEIGSMNIMFVYDDHIVTPPLSGTILPGVTRDSVIKLARHLGYQVVEERSDIRQIIKDTHNGALKEAFGCGTAAVISPIGELITKDERHLISNGTPGPVATRLVKALQEIQEGSADDVFSWRVLVETR